MFKSFQHDDVFVVSCGNKIGGKVLYWANLYFYRNIMVDSGCSHTAKELRSFLLERNLKPEALLITHYHEDHIGGASVLELPVYAGEKTIPLLENPPEIPDYRKIVWGQPEGVSAKTIEGRMNFGEVEVLTIETPGHSFDHVCFLIDDKLFMGDLVGSRKPIICMREENYLEVIQSLEKILKLDFRYAYGGALILSKEEVEENLRYLLELKAKVNELYSSGLEVEEIVERLFGKPPQKVLLMENVSGKEWARENLVRSLIELN
ncbi:MAG: MBL fold metallo-hydrolase [Archaeoglobus sp.]|nr:MBL fold metallo-hydrolase [Archaeoglobus sp.]